MFLGLSVEGRYVLMAYGERERDCMYVRVCIYVRESESEYARVSERE